MPRGVPTSDRGRILLALALILLIGSVAPPCATAVIHDIHTMTVTQQTVPNASVHISPELGTMGPLTYDRGMGSLTAPGGFGLFNFRTATSTTGPATDSAISTQATESNWNFVRDLYRSNLRASYTFDNQRLWRTDGFTRGQYVNLTTRGFLDEPRGGIPTGTTGISGLTPFGRSGGSPFIGTTGANGRLAFDYPLSVTNNSWTGLPSRPRLNLTAGVRCEGGFKPIQDATIGQSQPISYIEPCDDFCYLFQNQPRVETDGCSGMQLPSGLFQVQAAAAPADMNSQWAFKKLGLPLPLRPEGLAPVIVAVIDTGIDYRHPSIRPDNLWSNPLPGSDAEFPEDVLGWNFVAKHNNPWDDVGHGTFVAGLILAVNPGAKIMPLKVLDVFGNGLNSDIGRAVIYAVEHGARVINVSLGTKGLSGLHQAVVDYAREHGAVVVSAAGNEGIDTAGFTPAGVSGVFTVSATDENDKKPPFGNWGQNVALAAPGVDIVSLRARWTDFVLVATAGKDYKPGANFVGADSWLYRASGTSFAAPFVSGTASLLISLYPNLTGKQVERMLIGSADDIETPGWDQFTGAGRLNIARALVADPNAYLTARVSKLEPAQERGRTVLKVLGTADGNRLDRYEVQLGQGEAPSRWKTVATQAGKPVEDGLLAIVPVTEITARGKWSVRLVVTDRDGKTSEARGSLDVN